MSDTHSTATWNTYNGYPCRSWILLLFVLVVCAVVGLDRYLTKDAVKLCMESNRYNCEELGQIRETQNAQVCVGYGLKIAETLAAQVEIDRKVLDFTSTLAKRLAEENVQLHHCQTVIANYNDKLVQLLTEKGIELPEPDAAPTTINTAPPQEDRST